MKRPTKLLLTIAVLSSIWVSLGTAQDSAVAIVNVDVLPMVGDRFLEDQTVLIENELIESIGPASRVEIPEGARRVDGESKLLIPGLADMHVHLVVPTDLTLYLAQGVTTVLNMHGAPFVLRWQDEVSRGDRLGPTIFTTGPQIKVEENFGADTAFSVRSKEDVSRLIANHQEAGYDFLKVWGAISPSVFDALMKEAGRRQILVTGHIPREVGLDAALEKGMHSLAHVEEYFNKYFSRTFDRSLLPHAVEVTKREGAAVISTLVTYRNISQALAPDMAGLMTRPGVRTIDPVRRRLWGPDLNEYRQKLGSERTDWYAEAGRFLIEITRALHAGGVDVLAGTDAGGLGLSLLPGQSLHDELELLVEAGMSPHEALLAATRKPAEFLGGADRFGTIAPGLRADLVLLEADPRESIAHTRRIAGVSVRGRWLDRAELDRMLEKIAEQCAATQRFVERVLGQGVAAGIVMYEAAKREDPSAFVFQTESALLLAMLLVKSGEGQSALALLDLITRDSPGSYFPHYLKGCLLMKAGQRAAAASSFRRALELCPDHLHAVSKLLELDQKQ